MKEKSLPCETEAFRVQYWFGKGINLVGPDAPGKKYKYELVKTPRTPSQVKHLSFQGYILKKKKRQPNKRHVTRETSSKRIKLKIDSKTPEPQNALTSSRVAKYRLKEQTIASKRLKNTSKQRGGAPTAHQVISIKSSTQQELVKNLERFEPERHFRLCAIPMYPVFNDGVKRN